MKDNTVQKLAAYSTIKVMADSKKYKNQYYVLAEFIKFLISERNLYSFSILEMIERLDNEFDFSVPYAVVKSSLKKISGLSRNGDFYTVLSREEVNREFAKINKNAEIEGSTLISRLTEFACNENEDVETECLEIEFIKYILDRQDAQDLKYGDFISRFCLSIEGDEYLQRIVDSIREGSILYVGLCYNIIETGSVNDNITFYLDTEILFYLAGFNGQLSQKIVIDLMEQIKRVNKRGKRITLTFFDEVQEEVDRYFNAARNIVAGRGGVITSKAMSSIVNECEKESDVLDKQTDFFYKLEEIYGIKPDENKDKYYDEENHIYNLESSDNRDDDPKTEEAMRFISHINVLRKGREFADYMKSQYLIITETRKLIDISEEQKQQGKVGYAMSISSITNILWLKMGGVFGTDNYPYNVNIAVKARMALGKSIATSVNRIYTQTIMQYREGILQENQVAARILRLQEKIITPDTINETNVDELVDFSPESLQKYEEAVRLGKIEGVKKDKIIYDLQNLTKNKDKKIEKLQEQTIEQNNTIVEQKKEIELQKKEIQSYIDKDNESIQNKERKLCLHIYRLKTFAAVLISIILFGALGFLQETSFFAKALKGAVGLLSIYSAICTIWPHANIFMNWTFFTNAKINKINYKSSIIKWIVIDIILLAASAFFIYMCLKNA